MHLAKPTGNGGDFGAAVQQVGGLCQPAFTDHAVAVDKLDELQGWVMFQQHPGAKIACFAGGKAVARV